MHSSASGESNRDASPSEVTGKSGRLRQSAGLAFAPILLHTAGMIQIGSAFFDRAAQTLRSTEGSVPIALRAQSMRVLELLLDADGAMLSKDELASLTRHKDPNRGGSEI